jgi:site-specific recombinase XerD
MVVRVDGIAEAAVQAYGEYQRIERGLAERTVYNEAFVVRQFLAWRAANGHGRLEALAAEELGAFIVHEAGRLSPGSMVSRTSTVRTFVRFLFVSGVTSRDLSGSVPSAAISRFGGLPKAVDGGVVKALLASCDRARAVGRRDYAILVLMSRLGLRAAEIARMRLEDIDWRAGELEVRGKRGHRDRLPLPHDVGHAVAAYLRDGRPPSTSRDVFLRAHEPPVAMSRNAVVFVPRTASKRAGVDVVGGHRLRHTAGTELLRHGASLREVGQILRHDDLTTTAIYAKVDRAALGTVARAWPEGVGR